jgi:TolA-binding protein
MRQLFCRFIIVYMLASSLIVDRSCAQEDTSASIPGAEQYYSANALYNRKLYDLAIKEYEAFLADNQAHAATEKARLGVALSYYALGKHKEAEQNLKLVIQKAQEGDVNQLSVLRGQCLLKLNNPKEAEVAFSLPAKAEGKYQMIALSGLANAQFKQSKWAATVASTGQFLKLDYKSEYAKRAFYQGAYANYQLKKFADAIPSLEKLSAISSDDPNRYQAAFILAECYRERKELTRAMDQYKLAADGIKGKPLASVYYRLGFVHFTRKEYAEAIESFGLSLKADKGSDFAQDCSLYMGRARLEEKDYALAEKDLKPLGNGNAEAALWLGRVYSRQKKYDAAAKVLKKAVSKFKSSAVYSDMLFDYANALVMTQKYSKATQPLAELAAVGKFPQGNDVTRLQSICLHHGGDYQNSLKFADEFIAKYGKDRLMPEVAFVRAENLYLLGKLDKAVVAYQEFVSANPSHPNVNASILRGAQIYHKQGAWAKVITSTDALVQANPKGAMFSQLNFIVGNSYFRLERWKTSIEQNAAFLALHSEGKKKEPNVDSALVQMGVAHANMGNSAKAAEYFAKVVEEFPESVHRPLALSELGRMQYESGSYSEARGTLNSYLVAFGEANMPQIPQVEYYLGWTALATNNVQDAEKHFGVVVNSYAKHQLSVDASLQLGLMKLNAKKYKEAAATLGNLLLKAPNMQRKTVAMFSLGMAFANQNQWPQAEQWFAKVVTTDPKSEYADRSVYELAWCAKGLKKKDAAIAHYKNLLKTYPDSELVVKVNIELSELTFDAKNYDEVIEQLAGTLAQLKDKKLREETRYRLSTAYFNKGDYEKSAESFEAFITDHPKSKLMANAEFHAGESRLKLKETIVARDHFLAASKLKVKTASNQKAHMESTLMRLGETQGMTKQWKESAESYSLFAKEFPDSKWIIRARFGMAWAYERQGEFAHALQEYRRIVQAGKKDDVAAHSQFQIGECLFGLKKYDEAIQELVRVDVKYRNKDWSPKAALEIGRVLEAKGDKKGATESFKEVLKRYPNHKVAIVAKKRIDALRRQM